MLHKKKPVMSQKHHRAIVQYNLFVRLDDYITTSFAMLLEPLES